MKVLFVFAMIVFSSLAFSTQVQLKSCDDRGISLSMITDVAKVDRDIFAYYTIVQNGSEGVTISVPYVTCSYIGDYISTEFTRMTATKVGPAFTYTWILS